MGNEFSTLEAAQAEILRLQEEVTQIRNERDTLSQNNNNLSAELESVRKLNQQYFNKLSAQYLPQDQKQEEEESPVTCEKFAENLIIF